MNYKPMTIVTQSITADGRTFEAIGMGDVKIDLPNGSKRNTVILKECGIHSRISLHSHLCDST